MTQTAAHRSTTASPDAAAAATSDGPAARISPNGEAGPNRATSPVSVVILTLNEEINIADCIASCSWCDDVHVLDSGSTDRTIDIARQCGAQVHVHHFESFGAQRNWAIDNIPIKHDWIFHLDADERFTPELVTATAKLIAAAPAEAGFYVPNKFMFMGRWLKRAAAYPTYQMRLFHRRRMRFCDYGHGQRELTDGEVGTLNEPYLHFAFSKGLYDWLDKHNRYSSLEALQVVAGSRDRWSLLHLFTRDKVRRRRAWKEFGYHLPFRPFVRWFVTLFILGGILEGKAGRSYAQLIAMYEEMTTLKLRLLRSSVHAHIAGFERDTRPVAKTSTFAARDQHLDAPIHGTPTELVTPSQFVTADGQPLQMRPESSPWTFREKLGRAIWMLIGRPIFRMSFHNWYAFRAALLRLFGAKVGDGVAVRPTVHVEVPWMLDIDDDATIGDYAILYSLGRIRIGKRAIISQYAHLCAGTHDYTDHTFKLLRAPITLGDDVWIGADAFIGPGVTVGALTVVGARSSAYKDLVAKQVYVGNPAKPIKERILQ